jgi:hypothetical protein
MGVDETGVRVRYHPAVPRARLLSTCALCLLLLTGCGALGQAPPPATTPTTTAAPAAAPRATTGPTAATRSAAPAAAAKPPAASPTPSSAAANARPSAKPSPAASPTPAAAKPAVVATAAAALPAVVASPAAHPASPAPAAGPRAGAPADALGVGASAGSAAAGAMADADGAALCGPGAILSTRAGQAAGRQATIAIAKVEASYQPGVRGQPTFLNDAPYPKHVFTAVIWGSARGNFEAAPTSWQGKALCVTGAVEIYQQKPQIVVSSPSQLRAAH